ncbi:hypothetical protein, partial [Sphingobium limneticum]|uniref:hypothetical protein n=1 Tax=Sphingobium limneticum TaxID=1007511 RepID=UPI001B860109
MVGEKATLAGSASDCQRPIPVFPPTIPNAQVQTAQDWQLATTSGHFGLIRGTTYFDVSSHSVIINDQNEAQCCAAANFWLRKRQSHGPG